MREFPDKAYYARMRSKPASSLVDMALLEVRRRYSYSKLAIPRKPKVRVFHRGGKEHFVLRAGKYLVGAYSWDALIHKAAWGTWGRFDRAPQIKRRWR